MSKKKSNSNCLQGMQCPKCKSLEPFAIEVTVTVKVFDEGTDDQVSGTEWEDDAYCECCECVFTGTVKDFTIADGKEGDCGMIGGHREFNNADRAKRAKNALLAYNTDNDPPTNALDLLVDLQHFYQAAYKEDETHPAFDDALEAARVHFEAERNESL